MAEVVRDGQFSPDVRQDWNEDRMKLCRSESFLVSIAVDPSVVRQLSAADQNRLRAKLELVNASAARMAANMLKGTLKYQSEEHSVKEWVEYLLDDATDVLNYVRLVQQQLEVEEYKRWLKAEVEAEDVRKDRAGR